MPLLSTVPQRSDFFDHMLRAYAEWRSTGKVKLHNEQEITVTMPAKSDATGGDDVDLFTGFCREYLKANPPIAVTGLSVILADRSTLVLATIGDTSSQVGTFHVGVVKPKPEVDDAVQVIRR